MKYRLFVLIQDNIVKISETNGYKIIKIGSEVHNISYLLLEY